MLITLFLLLFWVVYKKEKVGGGTGDLNWISSPSCSATNNRAGETHHSAAAAPGVSVDKILDSLASVKSTSNNEDNKHTAWIDQV